VKGSILAASLILASAAPAAAQGELGAGLSFLHDSESTGTGFTVDYAQSLGSPTVKLVGDLGLNRFEGTTVSSYLGGVRVQGAIHERASLFGQFLIGGENCCDSTDLAFQPGVGLNIAINPMLNLRAQVDFRTVRFEGENFNSQRYTVGVSIPVGTR
jgi:hypothetical protein